MTVSTRSKTRLLKDDSALTNNIAWLLLLYTLQGVPMGMSAVFPLLLKDSGASYSELAWFSACSWPFALKMFWAPLVDSWGFSSIGKRKSWLIPSQLGIAFGLYLLAGSYESWLIDQGGVTKLTVSFFMIYLLAATQDIAVDGWALTLLKEGDVDFAGTCNSVGQTAGYFVAFSGFVALEEFGLCTLPTFMRLWAWVFLFGTIAVAVLKPEDEEPAEVEGVREVYSKTARMFKHPSILQLTIIMLTWKLPFNEGLVGLKIQEKGVPRDVIATIASVTTPIHLVLPWLVTRLTSRSSPVNTMLAVYPWRVLSGLLGMALVYFTPTDVTSMSDHESSWFYFAVLVLTLIQAALSQAMFVSQMAFFSRISDPAMGGTYMTVLNTVSNIGGMLATQVSLRSIDWFGALGVDGFYAFTLFGCVLGIWWWRIFNPKFVRLAKLSPKDWRINHKKDI